MYHVTICTQTCSIVLPAFSCRSDAIRMASHLALAYRGRVSITFAKENDNA